METPVFFSVARRVSIYRISGLFLGVNKMVEATGVEPVFSQKIDAKKHRCPQMLINANSSDWR